MSRSRIELIVAALLATAGLAGAAVAVIYLAGANTQLLGLALGLSFALIGVALIIASRRVVPDRTVIEERPQFGDPDEEQGLAADIREAGEPISRRKLMLGAGGAAATGLGAALVVPLASLGPSVGDRIDVTPWAEGVEVVDEEGKPILGDDVEIGAFVTGFPLGADPRELGSPIVMVKLEPPELDPPPDRVGWDAGGVVAFSKICTHAGCAINLYRYPLYEPASPGPPALVCPCHYSTFEPGAGGRRIFGPAGRGLPQLPLRSEADGRLVAAGPFSGPIGPAYLQTRRQGETS